MHKNKNGKVRTETPSRSNPMTRPWEGEQNLWILKGLDCAFAEAVSLRIVGSGYSRFIKHASSWERPGRQKSKDMMRAGRKAAGIMKEVAEK